MYDWKNEEGESELKNENYSENNEIEDDEAEDDDYGN